MTETAAAQLIARINNLPKLPEVAFANMVNAQGYAPTAAERAAIVAHADFYESIGGTRNVTVPVYDIYGSGDSIGQLVFRA